MDDIRPVSDLGREDYLSARDRPDVMPASGGVEWGTASLVFGAVFALMLPPTLLLVNAFHSGGDPGLLEAAGFFFGALILMLSSAGLAFGVLGMSAAQRARRPIALGLTGVMLNALNLLMWAGALVAWYSNWH